MLEGTSLPLQTHPIACTYWSLCENEASWLPSLVYLLPEKWIIHHFSLLPPNFPSLPLRFLVVLT